MKVLRKHSIWIAVGILLLLGLPALLWLHERQQDRKDRALIAAINLASADTLRIETLAGNDTVDSSGLQRGVVQLLVS